jgi:hypothetical protein
MLGAIASGRPLPEFAPTFRDGYRVAQVVDTIEAAANSRNWTTVHYATLENDASAAAA